MRVELSPPALSAPVGKPTVVTVQVTNTGTVISGYELRLLGLDPSWVHVDRSELSLFPDSQGAFAISVQLPVGLPAGTRALEIEVRELTPPHDISRHRLEITVPAQPHVSVALDPVSLTSGRVAQVGIVLENTGNTALDVSLSGRDDEGEVDFAFSPAAPHLAPGEQLRGEVTMRARRPWFGTPRIRPYVVQAGPPHAPALAHGAWAQRPRLTRGNLALAGLVIAATVFAIVITTTLSDVVSQTNANRDLALQVAAASQNHPVGGSSAISGVVTLLNSGAPLSGVTVDLYPSSSSAPLLSTATNATGGYHFSGLAAGGYKLSFTGAGFTQLYYPEALSASSAQVVKLGASQRRNGLDVRLGGASASVSGQVIGTTVSGAVLTLELPAGQPSTNLSAQSGGSPIPAVVTSVTLGSTGTFNLANIPAPAVYNLVVTEPGYATATQEIDLQGGESRTGVTINLHQGNGSITGTVYGPSGPLGGATIAASGGTTTANAVSATTAGQVGTFVLANLPTPASLTLVVSAPGYAAQSISVSLAQAQQVSGVSITLAPGVGSISGTVSTPPNSALGGVVVTVSNGSTTLQTTTLSVGSVGTYSVSGLVVPGTYTVTFSRSDLASQTQQVSLSTTQTTASVNATMVSETASISGTVTDSSGRGVGEVAVSLVSGSTTYAVTTASLPTLGSYAIDNVAPGTYDLSFTRPGGVPTSVIVSLSAGQSLVRNEQLSPAASIIGYVVNAANPSQPVPSAQVDLYLSNQYPTVIASTTTTNASGEFVFNNVQAPESFVVAVSYPTGSSPQETVIVTTSLGQTTPVCQANATGSTTTTTTVASSSTTTSTTTTVVVPSTTTTTLPSSNQSCNPQADPIEVSTS